MKLLKEKNDKESMAELKTVMEALVDEGEKNFEKIKKEIKKKG